jgi:hypothetical protein
MTTRTTSHIALWGMRVGVVLRTPLVEPAPKPARVRRRPSPKPQQILGAVSDGAGAAIPAVPAGIGRAIRETTLVAPAGRSLPETGQHEFLKGSPDMRAPPNSEACLTSNHD